MSQAPEQHQHSQVDAPSGAPSGLEQFDALAELARAATPDDERLRRFSREAATELRRRRAALTLDTRENPFIGWIITWTFVAFAVAMLLGEAYGIVAWLTVMAGFAAVVFHLARLASEKADTLATDVCRVCGYKLIGQPEAIPPALLEGLHVGPARCSECGVHWPGVPVGRVTEE